MSGGGKRPGSAGTPNKATAAIKALDQPYGPQAIEELAILTGLVKKEGRKPAENELAPHHDY